MAGHFALSVYPKTVSKNPVLFFGILLEGKTVHFSEITYETGVDKKFYEMGGDNSVYQRGHFLSYRVEDRENYQIGDKTTFMGDELIIVEKRAALIKGELRFFYRLGRKTLAGQKVRYNKYFSGLSLGATVIATDKETVRLHLDIDGQREVAAYPYHWTPPSGNLMYLMPQIGTRVSLYFSAQDERTGKATNSPRTDCSNCQEMTDYSNRTLTTEHNKQMNLFPNIMSLVGIGNEQSPLAAEIEDKAGIHFKSHKILDIIAAEQIEINAPRVTLSAPKQIEFERITRTGAAGKVKAKGTYGKQAELQEIRQRSSRQTIYKLHEKIEGKGQITYLIGTEYQTFPPHKDAVEIGYDTPWLGIGIAFAIGAGVFCLVAPVGLVAGALTTAVTAGSRFFLHNLGIAATTAVVLSVSRDVASGKDPYEIIKNAVQRGVASFYTGAFSINKIDALMTGMMTEQIMEGAELPLNLKRTLLGIANKIPREKLALNQYIVVSKGIGYRKSAIVIIDHFGNVYTGMAVSNGRVMPIFSNNDINVTTGIVKNGDTPIDKVNSKFMKEKLPGQSMYINLHGGYTQASGSISLFPKEGDARTLAIEGGIDHNIGIEGGFIVLQHIGQVEDME